MTQIQKSRRLYLEAREEFLSSGEPVVAEPILAGVSGATGWTISRGGVVLPSSRSGVRIFKTLGAVEAVCKEFGIDSFQVSGI